MEDESNGATPEVVTTKPAPAVNAIDTSNADANISWKNRRLMAYIALFAMIGLCMATLVIAIISITILDALVPIISVFVMAFGTIVGAYMGLATYADKWQLSATKR